MKKIGLLAGNGSLPVEFARAARGMGFTVVAVALLPTVDPLLAQVVDVYHSISIGQLGQVIDTLKAAGVEEVTMIGKVTKELMLTGTVATDERMQRLLGGLKNNSDDTVMLAFVRELASEGMGVLDQTALIRQLMPEPGLLTKRALSAAEQADVEFGLAIAKQMGGLDIGQTVVVKQRAVMAVEAIEGTDACIRRGGQLGQGGVTVVKVAKPNQDMRFDVPSVGLDTIRAMLEASAAVLAIEAGKTLVIAREEVVALADQHGLAIIVS